jgi:hypothetical protein
MNYLLRMVLMVVMIVGLVHQQQFQQEVVEMETNQ